LKFKETLPEFFGEEQVENMQIRRCSGKRICVRHFGKTTEHSIAHNVTMKTTNDAKFGAGDVTSPSKRFAFDGLKLSCKKKASLYKN